MNNQPMLPSATEQILQEHTGPITLSGKQGNYVVMRADVFEAMLGISDQDEAEILASTLRGVADLKAGRTHSLDDAFDQLDSHDAT